MPFNRDNKAHRRIEILIVVCTALVLSGGFTALFRINRSASLAARVSQQLDAIDSHLNRQDGDTKAIKTNQQVIIRLLKGQ